MRLLACLLCCLALPVAAADTVTVFAAASLKTALDAVARDQAERTGTELRLSYAGSSAVARQIAAGAPADVTILANRDWMDWLEEQGAVADGTRVDLLTNRLVLVGPAGASPRPIGPDLPLSDMLGDGRLAMALVDAVPAGIYGRQALDHLGLWSGVRSQVAQADNVRAALALVATGAAPLGVVYATDARAEPRVSVIGTFPRDSHDPIVYPAAATARGDREAAAALLRALQTPEVARIFADQGFGQPGE